MDYYRIAKLVLLPFAVLTLAASCHRARSLTTPIRDSVQPSFFDSVAVSAIQRIALLPFENGTQITGIDAQMQNHFAAALGSRGRRSVVNLENQHSYASCNVESVLRGEYPMHVLADAWRSFHADAVMFARVNSYSPYQPLSIGITVHIVDARDARLLATVDRVFSLADPAVLTTYRSWLAHRFPESAVYEVYQSSPTMFCEFVASQTVETLR
jgi:hypothetical protein